MNYYFVNIHTSPKPTLPHRLNDINKLYGNKKGMGESYFSPIPAFRPSHCPVSRISNADSPRQMIIWYTSAWVHYTLLLYK